MKAMLRKKWDITVILLPALSSNEVLDKECNEVLDKVGTDKECRQFHFTSYM